MYDMWCSLYILHCKTKFGNLTWGNGTYCVALPCIQYLILMMAILHDAPYLSQGLNGNSPNLQYWKIERGTLKHVTYLLALGQEGCLGAQTCLGLGKIRTKWQLINIHEHPLVNSLAQAM